jgi:hypothetical protein
MTATKVGAYWNNGSLVITDKNANEICTIDGNNRVVNFPSGANLSVNSVVVNENTLVMNQRCLDMDIADVSADANYCQVSPYAGNISKVYVVVDGAVSSANLVVTPYIGAVAVTNGVVTVGYNGSAEGSNASATPTSNRTVAVGSIVTYNVAGAGSGGSPRGHIVTLISAT